MTVLPSARRGAVRPLVAVLVLSLGVAAAALLASCGASDTVLTVAVRADHEGSVKPGDTPTYTLSVINKGPGEATGVQLRLDLPADFQYQSTVSISGDGATRVQAQDPQSRSQSPLWGQWTLTAPVVQADGTVRRSEVDVVVELAAAGSPGDYSLVPHALSDSAGGDVSGAPTALHLDPAPNLALTLSAVSDTVKPGDTVEYRIGVENTGSGPATGVDVLVTLPPGLLFERVVTTGGNSSRSTPVDPIPGSALADFGGYVIPARSDAGAGELRITFAARCSPAATGGRFPASVQLTDSQGTVLRVDNTAPITVSGPGSPTPGPTATPVPTLPPGATPSPTVIPTTTTSSTTRRRKP